MQPIGTADVVAAYHARLNTPHDAQMTVQILDMSERVLAEADLIDGQVEVQAEGMVRRTATLTLSDPDHVLGLDGDSPWQETAAPDRLVRVRHSMDVPGYGTITVTPFVGPIDRMKRDGATVELSCQDKAALATRGTLPYTVARGANAVTAIRSIMANRCGETHFRLPKGVRTRLPEAVNVGWKDEASPWVACQRIADMCGMQLLYSCDGYLTLRRWPSAPALTFDEDWLTTLPVGEHDYSGIVNHARVYVKSGYRTATIGASNELSPQSLARNGVNRYLPAVEELSAPSRPGKGAKPKQVKAYNTTITNLLQSAARRASALIETTHTDLSWTCVPVFHLDVEDFVRLTTPDGTIKVRFSSGVIPLGTGGDMSGGRLVRRVKPSVRRRGRNPRRARVR